MNVAKQFLNTPEAAQFTGYAASTLEKLRHFGGGPHYIKLPGRRRVLYQVQDLESWLLAGRRESTSESKDE